jgi:hypothetical protein
MWNLLAGRFHLDDEDENGDMSLSYVSRQQPLAEFGRFTGTPSHLLSAAELNPTDQTT